MGDDDNGMWWLRGACHLKEPTRIFFPKKGGSAKPAKTVCLRCPVTQECLNDALKHELPYNRQGIFGGLTPGERDGIFNKGLAN